MELSAASPAQGFAGVIETFVSSGHAVDLALALIVVEAVALWLIGRRAMGPGLGPMAPFLVAGGALLIGLRAALSGAPWFCVAGALALSGVAHLIDLWRRFRP